MYLSESDDDKGVKSSGRQSTAPIGKRLRLDSLTPRFAQKSFPNDIEIISISDDEEDRRSLGAVRLSNIPSIVNASNGTPTRQPQYESIYGSSNGSGIFDGDQTNDISPEIDLETVSRRLQGGLVGRMQNPIVPRFGDISQLVDSPEVIETPEVVESPEQTPEIVESQAAVQEAEQNLQGVQESPWDYPVVSHEEAIRRLENSDGPDASQIRQAFEQQDDERSHSQSGHNIPIERVRNRATNETELVEVDDSDDPVVDSDDEDLVIMEQPSSDVTFKPTSFDRYNNFNRPAPVHHTSGQSIDNQIALNQLQQRIAQYLLELHKMSSHDSVLRKEMQKARLTISNIAETIQNLLFQTSGLDPTTHGTLIDQVKRILADKERDYHQEQQKELNIQSVLQANMQRVSRYQHAIESSKSMLRSLGFNFHATMPFFQAPQPVGYVPNIYSKREDPNDNDLQDLIDNIQEDDEQEEGLEATPPELSITLMKHQRVGLTWMKRMESSKSKGGILADDMGLGKTVQAIALFMAKRSDDEACKTNLIIAPVSLLRQWAAELDTKLKSTVTCKVGIFHSLDKKVLNTFAKMGQYDVILTSYGTLSSEWKKHFKEALVRAKQTSKANNAMPTFEDGGKSYVLPFFSSNSTFYRIILDEAQNIKNKSALASKAVTFLKATYRFCLSGTPIQNNVDELFPIIRFLKIRPYNDEARFRLDISLPLKSTNYDDTDKDISIRKLRAILKAILLRRSKTSLIDGKPILSLPTKHIIPDYVQMHEGEKEFYSGLEAGIQKKAKDLMQQSKSNGGSGGHSISSILTLLLRLRQACCHQYLVEIGEMKQPAKKVKNWAHMFVQLKRLKSEAVSAIKNIEQYTCPICYNINDDSLVIFPTCGHMICQACTDTFIEDNTIEDGLVACVECKSEFKHLDIIDYDVFEKVYINGMDHDELATFYNSTSPVKTTNAMLLKQITDKEPFKPSAKLAKCYEMIQDIYSKYPNEKIIVFSQFTTLFDIMKIGLDEREIPFLRYDGTMTLDRKNETIKRFYQEPEMKVMLLSLRAGNSGLTLTCASHVIIMDPFWNPFVEEQAMDRAHRIGQEREVFVHKILITDTVETRIMELQDRKKEMVGTALDEKGLKSVSKLGPKELGFLFGINSLK